VKTFQGHENFARSVLVEPSGAFAVSGGEDGAVKTWDIATGNCTGTFSRPVRPVVPRTAAGRSRRSRKKRSRRRARSPSPPGRASRPPSTPYTPSFDQESLEYPEKVMALCMSPDCRFLAAVGEGHLSPGAAAPGATSSGDAAGEGGRHPGAAAAKSKARMIGTVRVWDLQERICVTDLRGHPHARVLAAAFVHPSIPSTTLPPIHHREPPPPVPEAPFALPPRRLLTTGSDGKISCWDLEQQACMLVSTAHQGEAKCLQCLPSTYDAAGGNKDDYWVVATAGFDARIVLWQLYWPLEGPRAGPKIDCIQVLTGHQGPIYALRFLPSSTQILSAGFDLVIRLWDIPSSTVELEFHGHENDILALDVWPEEKRLLSGGVDGLVRMWDLNSGRLLSTMESHTDWVSCVAFITIVHSYGKDAGARAVDYSSALS